MKFKEALTVGELMLLFLLVLALVFPKDTPTVAPSQGFEDQDIELVELDSAKEETDLPVHLDLGP